MQLLGSEFATMPRQQKTKKQNVVIAACEISWNIWHITVDSDRWLRMDRIAMVFVQGA